MTPLIGDLIQSTVGKVVGKLTDKYLPASMSEQEKAAFRLEAEKLAIEEYKTAIADVQGASIRDPDETKPKICIHPCPRRGFGDLCGGENRKGEEGFSPFPARGRLSEPHRGREFIDRKKPMEGRPPL